jgi:hypothetical protein
MYCTQLTRCSIELNIAKSKLHYLFQAVQEIEQLDTENLDVEIVK